MKCLGVGLFEFILHGTLFVSCTCGPCISPGKGSFKSLFLPIGSQFFALSLLLLYNVDVTMVCVVPDVIETSSFFKEKQNCFCCSNWVLPATLSSKSNILFLASCDLLWIPSSVFFTSDSVLFIPEWLFYVDSLSFL